MAIEFRCSECQQLLRVPDDSAGKNARCPKCQALMAVPAPSAEAFGSIASSFSPSPLTSAAPSSQTSPPPAAPVSGPIGSEPEFAAKPTPTPSATNPFGEAGGAIGPTNPFAPVAEKPSLNPYATPGGGYAQAPSAAWNSPRNGLPWETMRQSLGTWWKTTGLILGSPGYAFSQMRQHGGLGQPITFTIAAFSQVLAVVMALLTLFFGVVIAIAAGGGQGNNVGEMLLGFVIILGVWLVAGAFSVLINATLVTMFWAALFHLSLVVFGGAKQGYETTFRVNSYGVGSLAWLLWVPYVGAFFGGIWLIVLLIIGLAKAHDIPASKATLAVLAPVVLCCGGFAALYGVLIAVAISQQ